MGKAAEHIEHIVGVHSGEDEVAGQCRLHRDLCRFRIADFADHDLIRVVAQNRAQAAREGEALFFIHRNLQHAGQLILDRVFDGDDLVVAVVDFGNRCVERGGLAAAGGPGDQKHAVGLGTQAANHRQPLFVEFQQVEAQTMRGVSQRLLVEYAQHRVFAMDARHDGNAEIDTAAAHRQAKAPVLRRAPLGDIEFRHHLDARDHLLGDIEARRAADLRQHAIDAILDGKAVGCGFQVDVTGADFQRIIKRRVHQLDHRAGVGTDTLQREVFTTVAVVAGGAGLDHHAVHCAHALFMARQISGNVGAVRDHPAQRCAYAIFDPRPQCIVEGVGEHQHQRAGGVARQHAAALRRFGIGQAIERGRHAMQQIHAGVIKMQRLCEGACEQFRRQTAFGFERLQHRHAAGRRAARAFDMGAGEKIVAGKTRRHRRVHCRLPASSKIGI